MITYLNQIKDTRTLLCSLEQWQRMTGSTQTAEYIRQFRKTGDVAWKQRLSAVNFQGYDPAVLSGGEGSRKQDKLVPTGMFMLDVDHVRDPKAVYIKLQKLMKTDDDLRRLVCLVHITPSGKGLRVVSLGRKGSTIAQDQKWLADLLEVEHDQCTKDLSRWSFVPCTDDILYTNYSLLFLSPIEDTYTHEHGNNEGSATGSAVVAAGGANAGDGFRTDLFETPQGTDPASGKYPAEYRGIPYTQIVDRYINYHGGTPQVGERHKLMLDLAVDLRNITDNTVDWMMELIPNMGKTRAEKRAVITWAAGQTPKQNSKRLNAVLKELSAKYAADAVIDTDADADTADDSQSQNLSQGENEPPQMPGHLPRLVELLTSKVMPFQRAAVATMVFPALATHVSNCYFQGTDRKRFRLSMMAVLCGKQSVGKGCIDDPIEAIMAPIIAADRGSRERERAWAASQQKKGANQEGEARPRVVIRYLNTDTTAAALLQRLYAAENYGPVPNMPTYTKVDEIEELYDMSPTSGRAKITQLIRKCWDCGKIGSERFTSSAANFEAAMAWNWTACGTPERVRTFFAKSLTDGTLSRVDFVILTAPDKVDDEDFEFEYGDYDDEFTRQLAPYLQRLDDFGRQTPDGMMRTISVPQLEELEREMNRYIKRRARGMEDTTWKDYAWRAKVIAIKKVLVLYIANGCEWEDTFADFFRWSFEFSMWSKMALFYDKAAEAFQAEAKGMSRQSLSVLDFLPDTFTREQFYQAMKRGGFKTQPSTLLYLLKKRKVISEIENGKYTSVL